MSTRFVGLLLASSLLISRPTLAHAELVISNWYLATFVQNLSPPSQQESQDFSVVTNPFMDAHTATLGPGIATTSYDFSWAGDYASFRLDASHVTPDLGNWFYASISQGSINFTASVPLRARFTGAYSYSLPIAAADVGADFRVSDLQTNANYIHRFGLADTLLTPPPMNGAFAWDQTALIPAGRDCQISYTMRIFTTLNSGALATGSGYFQLTLEPVPEPAATTLFALAAACLPRRRQ